MPMISDQSPIAYDDPLPGAVDAVVIGAGVIGVSTAWYLAKQGVSILVCEKGRVAGEQSSRNWGWVRQQYRDPDELPIMMESLRIWEGLAAETGEDLGYESHGVLFMAETEQEMAEFADWMEIAKQHQLDTRPLTGAEIDDMIADRPGQWIGGLFTKSDGRAEPFIAVPRLAKAAQARGATIIENCAVRAVETQAGRVSGVITERGPVKTQSVVLAGGAWSSMLARRLGVVLPQLMVKSSVARTGPAPEVFAGNAAGPDFAFRRRADGGYSIALGDFQEHVIDADSFRYFGKFLPSFRRGFGDVRLRLRAGPGERLPAGRDWRPDEVSPFERTRVLNPAATPVAVKRMRARLARRLPSLAEIPIAEAWAGMIDVTPDVVPVMDQAESPRGFFIATGFSGHGFGIGPGAGRVMADLVLGKSAGHDLTRFRLSRFTDGSKMVLGPTL